MKDMPDRIGVDRYADGIMGLYCIEIRKDNPTIGTPKNSSCEYLRSTPAREHAEENGVALQKACEMLYEITGTCPNERHGWEPPDGCESRCRPYDQCCIECWRLYLQRREVYTCCDCGREDIRPYDNGDGKTRCEKCAVKKYKGARIVNLQRREGEKNETH